VNDTDTPFCFGTADEFCQSGDKAIHLPSNLTERDQLFSAYTEKLGLPDYFGRNWDAFSECLRDLSWIDERRVVIIHDDLPALDQNALNVYIDVLRECISDWQPSEDHELVAIFPVVTKQTVIGCLSRN